MLKQHTIFTHYPSTVLTCITLIKKHLVFILHTCCLFWSKYNRNKCCGGLNPSLISKILFWVFCEVCLAGVYVKKTPINRYLQHTFGSNVFAFHSTRMEFLSRTYGDHYQIWTFYICEVRNVKQDQWTVLVSHESNGVRGTAQSTTTIVRIKAEQLLTPKTCELLQHA